MASFVEILATLTKIDCISLGVGQREENKLIYSIFVGWKVNGYSRSVGACGLNKGFKGSTILPASASYWPVKTDH